MGQVHVERTSSIPFRPRVPRQLRITQSYRFAPPYGSLPNWEMPPGDDGKRTLSHPLRYSMARPMRNTVGSSNGRPTTWTASGRPSVPKPTGTVIAGWPVRLNGLDCSGHADACASVSKCGAVARLTAVTRPSYRASTLSTSALRRRLRRSALRYSDAVIEIPATNRLTVTSPKSAQRCWRFALCNA